jgi:hypothetical protein
MFGCTELMSWGCPTVGYISSIGCGSKILQQYGFNYSFNMDEVHDKHGQIISPGDHVFTKIRGGRHEGEVEKIIRTEEEAEQEGVKRPPKVGSSPLSRLVLIM